MEELLLPEGRAIRFELNERTFDVTTIEALGAALDAADALPSFELNARLPDGPIVTMLRNGQHAWLMFLREAGDAGLHSLGDASRPGTGEFTLGNGQVDEYPLAWCIEVEQCYQAIASICMNEGARPDWVTWVED